MLSYDLIFHLLGLCVVGAPAVLFATLGLSTLLRQRPLTERTISRCSQTAIVIGLIASVAILGMMLGLGRRHVPINLGTWVHIPDYHFVVKFEFDRLSVPFAILTFVLCGTIGAFASRYMHREPGYNRFFVLYSLFLLGMIVTSLSGTIETLFSGWEMVGLSSALLVAFFHERPAPVRNGLRVWVVYRFSDAALLIASVVLHHLVSGGDFDKFLGTAPWPDGKAAISGYEALLVGLLLLAAAAGKSALVPFSGWLPRAMEGPTPSSAVFYGALSVHLGAFLLLRVSPILQLSPLLCVVVVLLGLTTAVYAALAGHAQTDIKSALCFASLTQVGIIVAEIGLGLRYIALVHILGHACLRTLQFVRAPTLLQDRRILENAIGERLPRMPGFWERMLSERTRIWLYRFAIERGYLDSFLNDYIVAPFRRVFTWCDGMERRSTDLLTGGKSRESDRAETASGPLEELL
ncbi:MAG: proton-conducting transporter membrane subunit [Planctomycetota bacterium]